MVHTVKQGMPRKFVSSAEPATENIKVLLIDSSESFAALVSESLRQIEFTVEVVHSGCAGLENAKRHQWHLILLDVLLVDVDWVFALKKIRSFSHAPVVILADRHDASQCVIGLNLGADDYIQKNTCREEFLARLRALLRRAGWVSHETPTPVINEVVVGTLRLRLGSYTAVFGERVLDLTRTEFEVLLTLARNPGKVCTREKLVESTKGGVWQVFDRAIDMHISALRRILGDESREPRYIQTVRGVGYSLTIPDAAPVPPDALSLIISERPPQKFLPKREL